MGADPEIELIIKDAKSQMEFGFTHRDLSEVLYALLAIYAMIVALTIIFNIYDIFNFILFLIVIVFPILIGSVAGLACMAGTEEIIHHSPDRPSRLRVLDFGAFTIGWLGLFYWIMRYILIGSFT